MQARLIKGRMFDQGDVAGAAPVVMVNEAFARKLLPGEEAVGKRAAFQWGITGMQTIVGVVADMREGALRDDVPPAIYVPVTQRSIDALYVVVRGSLPSPMLTTLVRETVGSMDPNLALAQVRTLDDILVGAVAAFGLSRFIASQLYGIGPRDPVTFAISRALLAFVALAATFVPALRATRSDPLQALRAE